MLSKALPTSSVNAAEKTPIKLYLLVGVRVKKEAVHIFFIIYIFKHTHNFKYSNDLFK